MNASNCYYAAALVKQRAMHLEGQGNFYHERHIRQFCEYVDLIAAGINAALDCKSSPMNLKTPNIRLK